ncbi:MAG: DnaD domain protein [Anaerolineae bacterium]
MKTFSGFASGSDQTVSLPEQFFTDLLPLIDDALELKVTLACFRLFDQKSGLAKWTTLVELMKDPALRDVEDHVPDGVTRALKRGAIVGVFDHDGQQWLFANNELGRAAAEAIGRGESIERLPTVKQRPNIFVLYEQTIGSLTPLIAEQLHDAEQEYSSKLIEEAFAEAAKQNVRSWAYVKKILDNRSRKGKRDETRGRDLAADWQRVLKKEQRHK